MGFGTLGMEPLPALEQFELQEAQSLGSQPPIFAVNVSSLICVTSLLFFQYKGSAEQMRRPAKLSPLGFPNTAKHCIWTAFILSD